MPNESDNVAGGLFFRRRRDFYLTELVFVAADDFKFKTVEDELLSLLRNGAGGVQQIAGQSDGIFIVKVPAQLAVEVS